MGQVRTPIVVAILCVCATLGVASSSGASDPGACPGADVRTTTDNAVQATSTIFCLLEQERADRRLPTFRRRSSLDRAALLHGKDMVRNGFFGHVSSDGSRLCDRVRKARYLRGSKRRYHLGETIVFGINRSSTPAVLYANLLKSSAHRRLLLKRDFREIGVAVVAGLPVEGDTRPGATVVVDLGRRVANSAKAFKGAKTCVSSRKSSR